MPQDMDLSRTVFRSLCIEIDTPKSLGAWLRFKYEPALLTELSCNPRDYRTAYSFSVDYLICNFLKKYKGLQTGIDTREAALRSFRASEGVNCTTNRRIVQGRRLGHPADCESVLYTARRKISAILGDPPSVDELAVLCGFGDGATASLSRRRAALDQKLCKLPISASRLCIENFRSLIEDDLHWSYAILGQFNDGPYCLLSSVFEVTDFNVIDTVPKSSKIDRVIAKEPTLNIFVQKGIGSFIRSRLRNVGIDLSDQTANQRAARDARLSGLCTVDLAAASDTISKEIVYELLSPDWFFLLDSCRSKMYKLDGELHQQDKFSSMGNGFTFELESLIFWALAQSIEDLQSTGFKTLVFGDDIVCSRTAFTALERVFQYCGFTVNTEKSFTEGSFFESCGKHYFDDYDVTPAYQKEVLSVSSPASLIRCYNRLKRWSMRTGDHALTSTLSLLDRSTVGALGFRPEIPLGCVDDEGLISASHEITHIRRHQGVWRTRVYREQPGPTFPANTAAVLAYWLRRPSFTDVDASRPPEYGDDITIPLRTPVHRRGWRSFYDLPREFAE